MICVLCHFDTLGRHRNCVLLYPNTVFHLSICLLLLLQSVLYTSPSATGSFYSRDNNRGKIILALVYTYLICRHPHSSALVITHYLLSAFNLHSICIHLPSYAFIWIHKRFNLPFFTFICIQPTFIALLYISLPNPHVQFQFVVIYIDLHPHFRSKTFIFI